MSQEITVSSLYSGVATTAKVCADGSDTVAATLTGTEATNRLGFFTFTDADDLTGLYSLTFFGAGEPLGLTLWVNLTGDDGTTYEATTKELAMQVEAGDASLFTIEPVTTTVSSGRVKKNQLELYVAAAKNISFAIDTDGNAEDMTGKNLAFVVRKKNDKSVLFQKATGGDGITINGSTVSVTIEATDILEATEETEYGGALREVGGALDGHVWARCAIDVVYEATVDS